MEETRPLRWIFKIEETEDSSEPNKDNKSFFSAYF